MASKKKKIRPGTLNTALILGFGAAIDSSGNIIENFAKSQELQKELCERVSKIDGTKINKFSNTSPYITNLSVIGFKSEIILNFLSEKNIFVSNSSACSKGKESYVLKVMGVPKEEIKSSIRVSISNQTKLLEIKKFANCLEEATKTLLCNISN